MKDWPWLIVIAIFLMVPVILTIWHYPSKRLTARQGEALLKYGIIHFTKLESIALIFKDGYIKPSRKAMSKREENLTWFFLCEGDAVHSIQERFEAISEIRDANACVWVYGFSRKDLAAFRYRPDKHYLAHDGIVQKPMTAFMLSGDSWVEIQNLL